MNCVVCNQKIKRGQPHYRGFQGKGPWKHLACSDVYISAVDVDAALMAAIRELKRARFEIKTHRWREARPIILDAIDSAGDAVRHLSIWQASV